MTETKVPLTLSLPETLKDPRHYKTIELRLASTLISDHKHTTVKQYTKCARCTKKRAKRKEIMKGYGFESTEQYMEWRRIMDIITNRKDL